MTRIQCTVFVLMGFLSISEARPRYGEGWQPGRWTSYDDTTGVALDPSSKYKCAALTKTKTSPFFGERYLSYNTNNGFCYKNAAGGVTTYENSASGWLGIYISYTDSNLPEPTCDDGWKMGGSWTGSIGGNTELDSYRNCQDPAIDLFNTISQVSADNVYAYYDPWKNVCGIFSPNPTNWQSASSYNNYGQVYSAKFCNLNLYTTTTPTTPTTTKSTGATASGTLSTSASTGCGVHYREGGTVVGSMPKQSNGAYTTTYLVGKQGSPWSEGADVVAVDIQFSVDPQAPNNKLSLLRLVGGSEEGNSWTVEQEVSITIDPKILDQPQRFVLNPSIAIDRFDVIAVYNQNGFLNVAKGGTGSYWFTKRAIANSDEVTLTETSATALNILFNVIVMDRGYPCSGELKCNAGTGNQYTCGDTTTTETTSTETPTTPSTKVPSEATATTMEAPPTSTELTTEAPTTATTETSTTIPKAPTTAITETPTTIPKAPTTAITETVKDVSTSAAVPIKIASTASAILNPVAPACVVAASTFVVTLFV